MGDISLKGHSPILRQGFAKGGRAGFKHGTKPDWKKGKFGKKTIAAMKKHDFPAGGPHQSLEGKKAALRHASIRAHEHKHGRDSKADGGYITKKKKYITKKEKPLSISDSPRQPKMLQSYKKGGWIQSVNKSIKKRGTKGVCTGKKFGGPTCRPGTKRYALAKTFKKMAKNRKG